MQMAEGKELWKAKHPFNTIFSSSLSCIVVVRGRDMDSKIMIIVHFVTNTINPLIICYLVVCIDVNVGASCLGRQVFSI